MATNVELARGSYEAFAAGNREAYIDFFSEDAEWRVSAFLTGKNSYRGHSGIREFLADVDRLERDHGERFESTLTEFSAVDDERVIGLGQSRIIRQQNPLEFESGLLYRFVDGKIAELEAYTSHDETRRAAGLE